MLLCGKLSRLLRSVLIRCQLSGLLNIPLRLLFGRLLLFGLLSQRLKRRRLVKCLRQGIEQRGADVAGHGHARSSALQQLCGERGDGGFAVGACDGQHLGVVGLGALQILQGLGKQGQLGAHPQASGLRGLPHRGHRLRRQARAFEDGTHVLRIDQTGLKGAVDEADLGQLSLQHAQLRWRLTGVDHLHLCAAAHTPTRHRQARVTQAQNQHQLVVELQHRGLTSASRSTAPPGTTAW